MAVGIRKKVCAIYAHKQNDVSYTIRVREVDKTKVPMGAIISVLKRDLEEAERRLAEMTERGADLINDPQSKDARD